MDPGVLALLIPIVAIIAGTVIKVSKMKLESRQAPMDQESLARLEALEGEVDGLRRELSETQERVDFAERLLAQTNKGRALGPEGALDALRTPQPAPARPTCPRPRRLPCASRAGHARPEAV
jgi:DNA repair exonuclease SbcCD ATPase subunit